MGVAAGRLGHCMVSPVSQDDGDCTGRYKQCYINWLPLSIVG